MRPVTETLAHVLQERTPGERSDCVMGPHLRLLVAAGFPRCENYCLAKRRWARSRQPSWY